ncbi:hypothetical protein IEQ34_005144 [Dendrobium chrysotoxum]|uniref:Uncharacterized protein n=1 Tax=Dendrobium chrysotoxum TaxID=161865 RepID=A0AAV7H816_DENCH|nr:hypothetical protein IEQ34_005144 [Dendrobium chrysotoxum]
MNGSKIEELPQDFRDATEAAPNRYEITGFTQDFRQISWIQWVQGMCGLRKFDPGLRPLFLCFLLRGGGGFNNLSSEIRKDTCILKADGGGMDDRPDQDPMVPSSRAIVVPGFDAIGEHTGSGHNHNIMVPFGGDHLVQRAPSHNRLSCSAIWRRNCRILHLLKSSCIYPGMTYDAYICIRRRLVQVVFYSPEISAAFRHLPRLGEITKKLGLSHHATRACMVGVLRHRAVHLFIPPRYESVYGVSKSTRMNNTSGFPHHATRACIGLTHLAVCAAPGSLLPCYESAYRWFSGPL